MADDIGPEEEAALLASGNMDTDKYDTPGPGEGIATPEVVYEVSNNNNNDPDITGTPLAKDNQLAKLSRSMQDLGNGVEQPRNLEEY
jgi:hypothetical protein